MGRPTKCTPELTREFCEALELWGSIEDASEYAGIAASTAWSWLARGKGAGSGVYHGFRRAIARARVKRRLHAKGQICQRGTTGRRTTYYRADGSVSRVVEDPPDWRPLAWLLERDSPETEAINSPLFLLYHLRRLAREDTEDRDGWQHLADVVARNLARVPPFGAAADQTEDEVDEAEFGAELKQRGLDPDQAQAALDLLRSLRNHDSRAERARRGASADPAGGGNSRAAPSR